MQSKATTFIVMMAIPLFVFMAARHLFVQSAPPAIESQVPAPVVLPVQVEVQRFSTVEKYFKASNPHPLTHSVGLPRYERDVSTTLRAAIIERDGGRCLACGSFHNPHLPPGTLDMVLLVDVYHEFSHPQEMLAAMRRSIKPNGVIVLVDYRQEDPKVPIKPLHKMSKKQVDRELTANGFKLLKAYDELPWQHLLFYEIDSGWNNENAANTDQR